MLEQYPWRFNRHGVYSLETIFQISYKTAEMMLIKILISSFFLFYFLAVYFAYLHRLCRPLSKFLTILCLIKTIKIPKIPIPTEPIY